jgi:signal transduction histidine kinase
VVQEALHNVAKHAQAKNVSIQMAREQGSVKLLVEDDGIGFTQKGVSRGRSFGLAGMRERIAALGGTVRLRSSKGRGTRIEVIVPDTAAVVSLPVTTEAVYPARSVGAGSTMAS